MSSDSEREPKAIGWDAIDKALDRIYPGVEPMHWGAIIPFALGGPDPLPGLSAFSSESSSPHRHFITYGFSELYEKESDDPNISGYGFELTFRLARTSDDGQYAWVWNFLQNLARYVWETGRTFGPGHTLPLHGTIRGEYPSAIRAITFAIDPDLDEIDTDNGHVQFLQVVGITLDELEAIQAWNAESFLKLVAESNPQLVTDLDRNSCLHEASFQEEVRRRAALEGSSCRELYSDAFSFTMSVDSGNGICRLGAILVEGLMARVASRIPFGREFTLQGDKVGIRFLPGSQNSWELRENRLEITLDSESAKQLPELVRPKAGKYVIPGLDRLTIEVEISEIADNQGDIVENIG